SITRRPKSPASVSRSTRAPMSAAPPAETPPLARVTWPPIRQTHGNQLRWARLRSVIPTRRRPARSRARWDQTRSWSQDLAELFVRARQVTTHLSVGQLELAGDVLTGEVVPKPKQHDRAGQWGKVGQNLVELALRDERIHFEYGRGVFLHRLKQGGR